MLARTAFSLLEQLGEAEEVGSDVEIDAGTESEEEQQPRRPARPTRQAAPTGPPDVSSRLTQEDRKCKYWLHQGRCDRAACHFAHSHEQHREAAERYHRRVAEERAKLGWPPAREHRPQHPQHAQHPRAGGGGEPGVARPNPRHKTVLCRHWLRQNGFCSWGDRCAYAHGERELRQWLHDEAAVARELAAKGLRPALAPATPEEPPSTLEAHNPHEAYNPYAFEAHSMPREAYNPYASEPPSALQLDEPYDPYGPLFAGVVEPRRPPPGFGAPPQPPLQPAARQPPPGFGAPQQQQQQQQAARQPPPGFGPPRQQAAFPPPSPPPVQHAASPRAPPPPPQAPQRPAAGSGAAPMSGAALAEYLSTAAQLEEAEPDAPDWALCPITHELLTDPVVAADGFTYERHAIEAWLASKRTSPMTGRELGDRSLRPNHTLVACIRATVGEHACAGRQQ